MGFKLSVAWVLLFGWAIASANPMLYERSALESSIKEFNEVGQEVESGAEVLATWGDGGVSLRKDYESWRRWRSLDEGTDGAIEEFVYLGYLVNRAEGFGGETRTAMMLSAELVRLALLTKALQDHVSATVSVSDAEVEAYIHSHEGLMERPEKYRLSNIYMALGGSDTEQAKVRETMASVRERILEGADFGELAGEFSQSQTRFRGGAAGRYSLDELPDPVALAVKGLSPGEVSEVLASRGGLMLIRLEEIIPAVSKTLEEKKKKVRTFLTKQGVKRAQADLDERMLAQIRGLEIDEEELTGMLRLQYPDTPPDSLTPEQRQGARNLLWGGRARAAEARRLGLGEDERTQLALIWAPLHKLAQRVLSSIVDERFLAPAASEVRAYYEQHPELFHQLKRYRLSGIHFGEGKRENVAMARGVITRINEGEITFEDAARRYSKDGSSEKGGDMGWLSASRVSDMGVQLNQALGKMEIGQTTGLFNLSSGLWLFRLVDKQAATSRPFEEVKSAARKRLEEEGKSRLALELREELLAQLDIKISP